MYVCMDGSDSVQTLYCPEVQGTDCTVFVVRGVSTVAHVCAVEVAKCPSSSEGVELSRMAV